MEPVTEGKQHLSVVVLGPQGSGKSVLAGHFSVLWCVVVLFAFVWGFSWGGSSGSEHKKHVDRLEKECAGAGAGKERKWAWLLDKTAAERTQGSSVQSVHFRLELSRRVLTVFVVPGRKKSIRKAIPAVSQCDVGVLVLDGNKNELDASLAKDGPALQHALLAKTFGLKQLVVVVNKMDSNQVRYAKQHFEEAKAEVLRALKKVGYSAQALHIIPASGVNGENLVKETNESMPWWKGPSLMQLLNVDIEVPKRFPEKPLRLIGRNVASPNVLCGVVEQGVIRVGQVVTIAPRMITSSVESIQMHGKAVTEASAGDVVGVAFSGVDVADLDRANVVGDAKDPPRRCAQFVARVVVLRQCVIREGFTPVLACHAASLPCRFAKLLVKTDMKTKKKTVLAPESLTINEQADVLLVPLQPVCLDAFDAVNALGRFAILDCNSVLAVGFIRSVTWDTNTRIRVAREHVERLLEAPKKD